MPWDATPNAGFTTGEPWIELTPGWQHRNAAAQREDPDSVFGFYRRLIALRHGSRAGVEDAVTDLVIDGTFALLAPEHPSLWAFTRTLGARALLVVANCGDAELTVDGRDGSDAVAGILARGGRPILRTHDEPPRHDGVGHLILRPWESAVYLIGGSD